MTAALIVLVFAFACAVTLLAMAVRRIEFLTDEQGDDMAHEHAKCMSMVAAFVGDEFAARVLEAAANDWDSAEEMGNLKMLAREEYKPGGPSMPAIWMRKRGESLRRKTHSEDQ
jgi:hypothetical protein